MLHLAVWEYKKKHKAKDNWTYLLLPGNDQSITNVAITFPKCKHEGYILAGIWITEFKGGFTPCWTLGDPPNPFETEKYELYLITNEKIGLSPGLWNYEKINSNKYFVCKIYEYVMQIKIIIS